MTTIKTPAQAKSNLQDRQTLCPDNIFVIWQFVCCKRLLWHIGVRSMAICTHVSEPWNRLMRSFVYMLAILVISAFAGKTCTLPAAASPFSDSHVTNALSAPHLPCTGTCPQTQTAVIAPVHSRMQDFSAAPRKACTAPCALTGPQPFARLAASQKDICTATASHPDLLQLCRLLL